MKPTSTFQSFNPETGMLTVYKGADDQSGIHFHGLPENYNGDATEPAAPTSEYLKKQEEAEAAKEAEATE